MFFHFLKIPSKPHLLGCYYYFYFFAGGGQIYVGMEQGHDSVTTLVNTVCNFVTPPYPKLLQFCDNPPGSAPTHPRYNPVDCFDPHSTRMEIGYAFNEYC